MTNSANEDVCWEGRPTLGVRWRAADRYWISRSWGTLVLASIVWWSVFADSDFLMAWVLAGVWGVGLIQLTITRHLYDSYLRARIKYRVIGSKVQFLEEDGTVEEVDVRDLQKLVVVREGDLSSILFGEHQNPRDFPGFWWPVGRKRAWGFELLAEVNPAVVAVQQARGDAGPLEVVYTEDWHALDPKASLNPLVGARNTLQRSKAPRFGPEE